MPPPRLSRDSSSLCPEVGEESERERTLTWFDFWEGEAREKGCSLWFLFSGNQIRKMNLRK